jgi:repressor LexA
METKYTKRQGQYLSFIYYYTKIHGCPPAEADMQKYFRVSPPTVHQMLVTLEKKGLIEKMPHQARSIRLLVAREELPELE